MQWPTNRTILAEGAVCKSLERLRKELVLVFLLSIVLTVAAENPATFDSINYYATNLSAYVKITETTRALSPGVFTGQSSCYRWGYV